MLVKLKSYTGDLLGGIVGALITIPIILSCGVISYQNVGVQYITMGIGAAFLASVIASLLAGLFGKSPLHINSPKTTHAAILSGLIASIASSHAFSTSFTPTEAPLALISIALITLAISGITQMVLGGFKLGTLVKFIPYPVLAGFINGFALQIILNQVPKIFGQNQEKDLMGLVEGHLSINFWALMLGFISAFIMVLLKKKIKLVPPALISLLFGTLLYLFLHKEFPQLHLGQVIGNLPQGIAFNLQFANFAHILSTHFFMTELVPILITGVTLAFISSIQSLLSISATEHLFKAKHNSNRELMIQGAGNFLSAILGGTPTGGSPNTTQAVHANGGKTGVANIVFALTILAVAYGLNHIISLIPLSVMAGVVIMTTLSAMDKWTRQLFINIGSSENPASQKDVLMNLVVVILVTSLVIFSSAIIALGFGLLGVFIAFLYRSNARMIRRTLYGTHFHSRTERDHQHMEALKTHGHEIAIIELDGPIFFGSSESVAQYIESILPKLSWLILDLKRVSHMDSSGVMMLKRIDEQMKKDKKTLLLSYLPERGNRRQFLEDMGYTKAEKEGRIYINTDMALGYAEDELIQKVLNLTHLGEAIDIQEFEILKSFSDSEIKLLEGFMQRKDYKMGELISENEEKDNYLLFLLKGRMSIMANIDSKNIRSSSYRSGMCLGNKAISNQQKLVSDMDSSILMLDLNLLKNYTHLEVKLYQALAQDLNLKIIELHDVIVELEEN